MAEEKIPFGEKVLSFSFPSEWEKETLHPNPSISFDHPDEAILQALENPIHSPPLRASHPSSVESKGGEG